MQLAIKEDKTPSLFDERWFSLVFLQGRAVCRAAEHVKTRDTKTREKQVR